MVLILALQAPRMRYRPPMMMSQPDLARVEKGDRDGSPLFMCTPLPPPSPPTPSLSKEAARYRLVAQCDDDDDCYDYSLSTSENHHDPSAEQSGKYRGIRARLDAGYHGVYSRSRQELQDALLDSSMRGVGGGRGEPWIIFTAGAMGSGKSHTFTWMVEQEIVPLENVQIIDPDMFKTVLPEWPGYLARDPLAAGQHTRKESGYLVEIAQEAAMRAQKHVWVDGSLRDSEWYQQEFARIAREHPEYRIAILHVVASRDVVMQRVLDRAAATGRHVPVREIDDSLARVPRSVDHLRPLADFLAVVDNSGCCPRLVEYCDSDACYPAGDEWAHLGSKLEVDECATDASPCDADGPEASGWEQVSDRFGEQFLLSERG